MPGVGEAGASIAKYALVEKIVKKAHEAKRLKSKCHALGQDCQRLRTALDSNTEALADSAIDADLRSCLDEVLVFVEQCTRKWSYLHNGWEVIWERRYPDLQGTLSELTKALMLESVLAQRTDLRTSTGQFEQLQASIAELTTSNLAAHDDDLREREADRLHRREITDALISELRISKSAPKLKIAFRSSSSASDRISSIRNLVPASSDSSRQSRGDLVGLLDNDRRVLCRILHQSRSELEQWIPKPARIYGLLAKETQVQGYFGILEHENHYYSVWEDISHLPSIQRWLRENGVPGRLAALRIAYEIASTMAYFHSVQVLLKTLSGETVIMQNRDDSVAPILTEIERARMLVEPSQRVSYDVRYEAPEYLQQRHHSKFTDVWSLGIIIWQIVSAGLPFGVPFGQLSTQKNMILARLEHGEMAWGEEQSISHHFVDIKAVLHACCSKSPLSRPTASEVASKLLNILTMEAAQSVTAIAPSKKSSWDAERASKISDTIAARRRLEAVDFLFLTANAKSHACAAHLVGLSIWKEVVHVDTIAEYSDEYSHATYMTPEEKRARRALLYLQNAANAGFDDALRGISDAYQLLSQIYDGRHKFAMKLPR